MQNLCKSQKMVASVFMWIQKEPTSPHDSCDGSQLFTLYLLYRRFLPVSALIITSGTRILDIKLLPQHSSRDRLYISGIITGIWMIRRIFCSFCRIAFLEQQKGCTQEFSSWNASFLDLFLPFCTSRLSTKSLGFLDRYNVRQRHHRNTRNQATSP